MLSFYDLGAISTISGRAKEETPGLSQGPRLFSYSTLQLRSPWSVQDYSRRTSPSIAACYSAVEAGFSLGFVIFVK